MAKYFVGNMAFSLYCREFGLNYDSGNHMILYRLRNTSKSLEEITEEVVKILFKKKRVKEIKDFFKDIEDKEDFSLLNAARVLNISYRNVYNIYKMGYKKIDALYIVWYLGDKILKNGKKVITQKKLQDFRIVENLSVISNDTDFMTLLTLYKMGNITEDSLTKKREKYLINLSYKILRKYKHSASIEARDLYQIINAQEFLLYNKLCMDNIEQNIKYLNIFARFAAINYLNSQCENILVISLDDNIDDNRTYYDVISNTRNGGYYGY